MGVHRFPSSFNLSVFEPIVEVISFAPGDLSSFISVLLAFSSITFSSIPSLGRSLTFPLKLALNKLGSLFLSQ